MTFVKSSIMRVLIVLSLWAAQLTPSHQARRILHNPHRTEYIGYFMSLLIVCYVWASVARWWISIMRIGACLAVMLIRYVQSDITRMVIIG
jgi:hypothetical protein